MFYSTVKCPKNEIDRWNLLAQCYQKYRRFKTKKMSSLQCRFLKLFHLLFYWSHRKRYRTENVNSFLHPFGSCCGNGTLTFRAVEGTELTNIHYTLRVCLFSNTCKIVALKKNHEKLIHSCNYLKLFPRSSFKVRSLPKTYSTLVIINIQSRQEVFTRRSGIYCTPIKLYLKISK